jgi:hypothetical protein
MPGGPILVVYTHRIALHPLVIDIMALVDMSLGGPDASISLEP